MKLIRAQENQSNIWVPKTMIQIPKETNKPSQRFANQRFKYAEFYQLPMRERIRQLQAKLHGAKSIRLAACNIKKDQGISTVML